MRQILLAFLAASALSACGRTPASGAVSSVHQRSADVSLIAAERSGSLCYLDNPVDVTSDTCSGNTVINAARCDEISRQDTATERSVKKDCRREIARVRGVAPVSPVIVNGSFSASEGRFVYNETDGATDLLLTVKKAAFDAPTFAGLGLFVNEVSYSFFEQRPGPGSVDVGLSFTRDELLAAREGEATLQGGDAAYVFRLMATVSHSYGGASVTYATYLRPYVRFLADGEEYFNWDAVGSDYFLNVMTSFDRRLDVIR